MTVNFYTLVVNNDIIDLFFFMLIEDSDFNDLILKKDFIDIMERYTHKSKIELKRTYTKYKNISVDIKLLILYYN